MPICHRKSIVYIIFIALSAFRGLRSEKPVIIQRPINQNVHVNQSAKFVCGVQSTLPFTIDWMRDDGHNEQLLHMNSYPGSLLVVNGNLTFLRAKHSDEGIYKCTAKNKVGKSSAQATLRVLNPPVAPTITEISPNKTIVEGKRVTFTCKASGNPLPQITWKISLESGFDNTAHIERPSPQSIRISSASPGDAGKYVCIAENDSGNDADAVYLNVVGYPVFIVSPPSNLTVHEDTPVSLNCKVIGSPKADVNWYYGNVYANQISNVIILDNNTLHIYDVKFGNSGRYTCVANNSAGLQRSKSTLLKVSRAPKLDCCPNRDNVWQNQTGIAGQPNSLYCSAAGYPEPEYVWMFQNKTISSFSVFTINNVSTRNEGVYSCKAKNSLGVVSLMIYLNVVVPPQVSVQPPQAIAGKGDRVEFKCTATGLPLPTISWYSSKKLILRNDTLAIVNISKNDQGEYFCEAKNDAGQKTIKARLVVAVHPTFLILPRNISVNESSSVNIQCLAQGPDEPIINWYRLTIDNQKINLNLSANALTITKVDRNVTGFYVCEAKNYAGCINTTFFINVQYRPYPLTSQQKVSIVMGKPAILFCPIKANPVAEIQWTNPIFYEGPRLTIAKVDTSHRGEYSCRGKNILGAIEVTLQVQILTAPLIVNLKMVELQNNFVTLTCVTMEAESIVDWIDLTPLPSGSFSVHRGTLQIEKRYINAMNFICNASNAHGWMIKYVRAPTSPHNFSITKISSKAVTLVWSYDNAEIISNFIAERRSTSHIKWVAINSSVASPWYEDRDLSPFTTFMYRISAENALGRSKPGGIFNASTQEGVPSSPSKIEAESFSLTSITVYWEPPYEPRGQLTDIIYELCYKESTSPQSEVKITVNTTVQYTFKIRRLKSNTLYIVKIRAGRQTEGSVQWSDYKRTRTKTLQKAPTGTPKEIKAVSNGPRKIYVTWKIPLFYVEGYKLQHKEYESTNITKVVIRSWNSSSFMITGLAAGRYYEIQMNMFTNGGDGPWSDPKVVHTDQDRLSLPGPIASSSDSLPWKIAVGGSVMAIVLLLLLLVYIYLVRKSKHTESSDSKKTKKSRNQGGYDFTDNASRVSNESEGSIEGVYNVNIENDIDLSMFDNSHHSDVASQKPYLYIENPILPAPQEDSDDSYEAVRLATFIARPSPQSTPYMTDRRQLSENHVNPAYHSDTDDDIPMYAVNVGHAANLSTQPGDKDIPVYAQVDFAAKERDRQAQENNTLQQFSDDILI